MMVVLNGVEPSIYSPTRTVHGDLNLVGGETVLCMLPYNRLKKVGQSCRHGAPLVGPLTTAFAWSDHLWALILLLLRMDPVRCFGGLFHLSLIYAFSEYAFLKSLVQGRALAPGHEGL